MIIIKFWKQLFEYGLRKDYLNINIKVNIEMIDGFKNEKLLSLVC